jgi:putative ABC transport system permease protein
VFLIALRDLQFRLRRFLISVVAVALVLALTLLLAGVAASFDAEVDHTLDQMHVTEWVVASGATGPFFGATPMTADTFDQVRGVTGIESAAPQTFYPYTFKTPHGPQSITLLGVQPGGIGAPTPSKGRPLQHDGEALVQPGLGLDIGKTIDLGNKTLTIVGTFGESTMLGGIPNLFLSNHDLQAVAYKGAPVITSVAITGTPTQLPQGLKVLTRADAHNDLVRPLHSAKDTISLISILLWIVAGCIIGSVIYLSALERVRDFAVFKAIGVSTRWVLGGLVLQAIVLSAAASVVAIGVGWLLAPQMSVPVVLPIGVVLLVPLTAIVVSVIASLVGVRRAVRVDPALAFG